MKIAEQIIIFILVGIITLLANSIGYNTPIADALAGMGLLIVITLAGQFVAAICPVKIPMVFWISVIALLSTSSLNPAGQQLAGLMNKINFMAIATPILAYAGLSIGKDLKLFKNIGWQMVIVALAVYTGTFLFATVIAQIIFAIQG